MTSTALYICLGLGLVYTLIYLYAMSLAANLIAYIAIGMIEMLWLAAIGTSFYMAIHGGGKDSQLSWWIATAFVFFSAIIFNCLMCCFWSKMKVAIAVIDATADFVVSAKRLVLVALWYFIVSVIVFLIWAFGLVFVVSLN